VLAVAPVNRIVPALCAPAFAACERVWRSHTYASYAEWSRIVVQLRAGHVVSVRPIVPLRQHGASGLFGRQEARESSHLPDWTYASTEVVRQPS